MPRPKCSNAPRLSRFDSSPATISLASRANALMRAALSAYAASFFNDSAYSFTISPQPLAVITMASTPLSTWGHHASILRRIIVFAPSGSDRCWFSAPQQPAPCTLTSEMPSRSNTRAAAAFVFGVPSGCTQPSSTSMRRAWVTAGVGDAICLSGILFCSCLGSSGRSRRASVSAADILAV